MKEDILGYLFDALDAEEEARIERLIDEDPAFRQQVEELRRLTMPLAEDDCIEPPPGLAERTLKLVQSASVSPAAPYTREWSSDSRSTLRPLDFAVSACLLGIAALLVFPAIASIRGDHARILCTNQLRQLGVSLAMYAHQENGQFPFIDADGPMSYAGAFAIQLKSRDLLPDEQVLVCPSANSSLVKVPSIDEYLSEQDPTEKLINRRRYMSGSYGYALGFRQNGQHKGLTANSDMRPVLSDRPPRQDEIQFSNSPNHRDHGQNVLCAGGSVRWIPCRVFGKDDLFRNHACQVAAGVGPTDTVIGVSEAVPYPSAGL